MAGKNRKRSTMGRIAIIFGLGIATLSLLWFAYDLAQIALPAPALPEWAESESPQQAQGAQAAAAGPSATPTPVDQGMVPVVLPADPSRLPAEVRNSATQTSLSTDLPPTPRPTVVGPTPSPTFTPVPTEVPEIPIRIVIPFIDLDAPVIPMEPESIQIDEVEYQQWKAPDEFAAGWHTTSARLGEGSNTVLNGHHNIDGKVFGQLVDLEEGAIIEVYGDHQTYAFQVTQRMVLPERDQPLDVRLENASWIAPTEDERLTLITCWPANSNTHRLIIVASPVDP